MPVLLHGTIYGGFVMWRVISTYEYVLLLDNYESETGDFMVC